MITDVEAVTSAQEIQGQRVQQGSTVVEENRTLKQQMTQIRQAWANGQGQPCHESRFATQQEQYHSPEYHSYSFELPVNIEKPARKRVQEEITQRVKRLEQRLKNTQAMASQKSVAFKWREQAARAKPPMDDHELITAFLQAQEPDYFQYMTSAVGKSFPEAIKMGEMMENGLKTGRIISQTTLKAAAQAVQIESGNMNEGDEEIMVISGSRRGPRRTSRRYVQPHQVSHDPFKHYYPPPNPPYSS
ncbi:uncharacterized protein LOC107807333 [Nicotiana tabacum]|uniref:uncharacterized protein LOC107807333 n=1 Tax=Nicotiana tabacum TaxID=4097 RepID=UPI003F4ECC39